MKNLSIQITEIIKNEINLINKKISGISLLEILKYKIIDYLIDSDFNAEFVNTDVSLNESIYENDSQRFDIKLISNQSKMINFNSEISKDTLIICIKEPIDIMLEDHETKKKLNIKFFPNMGLVIPKGMNCSLNFSKNSMILEIKSEEIILSVEN